MKITIMLACAAALGVVAIGPVAAKPCATGTTTGSAGEKTAGDKSSAVDPTYTKNVSPGAKEEHPGAVGAMDKVGANQAIKDDEKKPAEGQVVKQGSDDC